MKLWANLLFIASSFVHSTSLYGQIQQFEFTAFYAYGGGTNPEHFGDTLTGVITVDYSTPPDHITDQAKYCGEEARWNGGNFTVDVMTDRGYAAGSLFDGGRIEVVSRDQPCRTSSTWHSLHSISNIFVDSDLVKFTQFYTVDNRERGDGIADWFDFDPTGITYGGDEFSIVYLNDRDRTTGLWRYSYYRVDSFKPLITNILIDEVDTGIEDFKYEGTLVSELIQTAADSAKNHGKFVSSVARLTNELKKAGLITDEEKFILMETAAESTLGH